MPRIYDDVNFDQDSVSKRDPHPAGICRAVAVDVIDMPHEPNRFYDSSKEGSKEFQDLVKIVFETEHIRPNGKQFSISMLATKSLYDGSGGGPTSKLYRVMSSWFGPEWNGRFESSKIVGRPALLVIEHSVRDGRVRAKISSVLPDQGDPYQPSGEYKRWVPKDGPVVREQTTQSRVLEPPNDDDEDIPF